MPVSLKLSLSGQIPVSSTPTMTSWSASFSDQTLALSSGSSPRNMGLLVVKKEGFRLENEVKERAKRNEKCYGGSVWRLEIPNRKDQGRTLTPSCCSAGN
ncbi:hypothetical protein NC651_029265 [Populus alba x Populus x berolinensis]|nr:hypothetical protein NC651_029265 [Populus alba x Populus x berolinensis]